MQRKKYIKKYIYEKKRDNYNFNFCMRNKCSFCKKSRECQEKENKNNYK